MLTRKLIIPGSSAAALLLGLFSHQAAATEEIVVYGAEAVALAQAREALFRSQLDQYVQSLNEQIEATLHDDLKRVNAPKLELASSEDSIRG